MACVGIDLGTTHCSVAIWEDGGPRVLALAAEGGPLLPSVVAFGRHGERYVGGAARRLGSAEPARAVYDAKRLIGRPWPDVAPLAARLPYAVHPDPHDAPLISVDDLRLRPEEIAAQLLQTLKEAAQEALGEPVTGAVITVPAYFDEEQRKATRDAGRLAGLEVLALLSEPTAAALAFRLAQQRTRRVLVYDLGGGTFDVSVLEMDGDVVQVLAVGGDTWLGGQDLTAALADALCQRLGLDLGGDLALRHRLHEAAEAARRALSSQEQVHLSLPFFGVDDHGAPRHLSCDLARPWLEELINPFVQRTLRHCQRALLDAALEPEEIDAVLLVGGTTRTPLVRRAVARFFGRDPHAEVDPDLAVALGAATRAGLLTRQTDQLQLLDVNPLSLGVEVRGGLTDRLIPRNMQLPNIRKAVFTTTEDDQEEVVVHVVQGERELAADNRSLGRFTLAGLPKARRGVPQIEVSFALDQDGILTVTAQDRATGSAQEVQISARGGLDDAEIERLVQEGRVHARQDAQRRARIEDAQRLERDLREVETTLEDPALALSPDTQGEARRLCQEARRALLEGHDDEAARHLRALERLAARALRGAGA